MRSFQFLVALIAIGFSALTARAAPLSTPKTTDELRSEIEKVLKRTNTPGAGIAIVMSNGVEWIAGVGLANVAIRQDATAETLFRIGSISKSFVALAMLKLQEEGKLSLQDTLKSRAPDLEFSNPWEATDPVRIVHLLEHTSGWDDMMLREYAYESPQEISLKEALLVRPKTRTSRWKPGTRFSYSNAGPAAAAFVVEKVTGQRFEDYIAENFFRPIGMTTANYFGTAEVLSKLTQCYRADGKTPYPYWKIIVRPSGSINASARDMANYVQFYLNRGEFGGWRLLPETAIERMETPATTYAAREGLKVGYGLHNYASQREGWVYHGHNGGVMGGLSEMSYQTELGVGYCVMINSGNGGALNDITRLVRNYITRDAKPSPKPAPAPIDATLVAGYGGWYEMINPRNEIWRFSQRLLQVGQLKPDGTGLVFRKQKFVPTGGQFFRNEHDPLPTLALIADRSEGTLVQMGGVTYRRTTPGQLGLQVLAFIGALLLMAGSVVFAFVWVPRRFWGRLRGAPHLRVRALPLYATLAGAGLLVVFAGAAPEIIERLGRITPWSVSLFVLTLAFPALAVWGLLAAWQARFAAMHRLVWWHSFATSLAATGIAGYLAYWGLIGLRLWA